MLRRTLIWMALLVVLFSSGAAGLINQVVWQRALKVFLGGSESISSMIVVVVFLGGLGAGSWLAGRSALSAEKPAAGVGGYWNSRWVPSTSGCERSSPPIFQIPCLRLSAWERHSASRCG